MPRWNPPSGFSVCDEGLDADDVRALVGPRLWKSVIRQRFDKSTTSRLSDILSTLLHRSNKTCARLNRRTRALCVFKTSSSQNWLCSSDRYLTRTMMVCRLFSNEHPTTLGVKGSSEGSASRCAYKNCCVEIELLHGGFSGSYVLRVERYAINGQIELPVVTKLDRGIIVKNESKQQEVLGQYLSTITVRAYARRPTRTIWSEAGQSSARLGRAETSVHARNDERGLLQHTQETV